MITPRNRCSHGRTLAPPGARNATLPASLLSSTGNFNGFYLSFLRLREHACNSKGGLFDPLQCVSTAAPSNPRVAESLRLLFCNQRQPIAIDLYCRSAPFVPQAHCQGSFRKFPHDLFV